MLLGRGRHRLGASAVSSVRRSALSSTFKHEEHDMAVNKKDAAQWTGGCQCGAVRYQLRTPPEHACICHCRMCQRASGQPFMAFASVRREHLRWTRGRPSIFVSSNVAERHFCSACGTPLTYHRVESGSIAVTIGSLDSPEAARPVEQFGIESQLSWTSGLKALPAKCTEDWMREYGIPQHRQSSVRLGSAIAAMSPALIAFTPP
jgi:hypothetical protein